MHKRSQRTQGTQATAVGVRRAATTALGAAALLAAMLPGCLIGDDDYELSDGSPECFSDISCTGASACREARCVSGKCVTSNVPDGAAPTPTGSPREVECRRIVCDGQGNERSVVDQTVLPKREPPACQRFACSPAGDVLLFSDPSNGVPDSDRGDCQTMACDALGGVTIQPDVTDLPADVAGDCRAPACGADGRASAIANPSDVPADQNHDCQQPACAADGTITSVNDDADVPADTTCETFACADGVATASPINEGQTCSDLGFVCNGGNCNVCPAPDASCADPGPGQNSQSAGTAFDFGGIGHCDSGGRSFCGAVAANETTFYSFRDNDTGTIFCEFDPSISISSTAPVTLCEYFSCGAVTCPGGSTPSTSGDLQGCCVDADSTLAAMRINPCGEASVLISVRAKPGTTCAGYTLRFNL